MLKVVIVAGSGIALKSIVDGLNKREFEIDRTFTNIEMLWQDIMTHGNSSYLDVDKIIILGGGYLNENEMSMEEQLLNIQSTMEIQQMRSTLYCITKDTDLYSKVQENQENLITYRNFNLLVFSSIHVKDVTSVLKGNYDAKGLYHEDFLRKNEIDRLLDQEDIEEEEEVEEKEPIVFDGYVDTAETRKEIQKKEALERKMERKKKAPPKEPKEPKAPKVPKGDSLIGKIFKGSGSTNSSGETDNIPVTKTRGKKDFFKGVIAVTGDRQSGVSTTVSNMAEVYANNGNSVLIVDLDIKRRMQTIINPQFEEAIKLDSRVSQGLLVSLVNPSELENVYSVVRDNVAVLSISTEVDKDIKKFANQPFNKVYSSSNLVNLFSFAKSLFDVILIDIPWERLKSVGNSLSYVDKVVLCIPNTGYHLDNILDIEFSNLFDQEGEDFVGHNLMSKSNILLTKYNKKSKFRGREMTPKLVNDTLSSLEETIYHINVIGKVNYSENYESQFERGRKIVNSDANIKNDFENFMTNF